MKHLQYLITALLILWMISSFTTIKVNTQFTRVIPYGNNYEASINTYLNRGHTVAHIIKTSEGSIIVIYSK